jgi:NADP-reducing hydrogenase subunit HndB
VHVDAEKAKKIVAQHLVNGNVVREYTVGSVEK